MAMLHTTEQKQGHVLEARELLRLLFDKSSQKHGNLSKEDFDRIVPRLCINGDPDDAKHASGSLPFVNGTSRTTILSG